MGKEKVIPNVAFGLSAVSLLASCGLLTVNVGETWKQAMEGGIVTMGLGLGFFGIGVIYSFTHPNAKQ